MIDDDETGVFSCFPALSIDLFWGLRNGGCTRSIRSTGCTVRYGGEYGRGLNDHDLIMRFWRLCLNFVYGSSDVLPVDFVCWFFSTYDYFCNSDSHSFLPMG